jgi:RNA polymerase sigma-70 factor, ECF subfamily
MDLALSTPSKQTTSEATDLPSFAEAVEAQKAMVFSIAWNFLRDRSAADEIAQEVFLELYRRWHQIQSREHLVFWLRKVASHRCLDAVRKRKQHPETSLEESAEPTALERVHDPMLSTYLARMVASLPEKQRVAVILRYQEGMEPEEISEVLGIHVSTVKSQIARALELLRAKTAQRLGKTKEPETDERF